MVLRFFLRYHLLHVCRQLKWRQSLLFQTSLRPQAARTPAAAAKDKTEKRGPHKKACKKVKSVWRKKRRRRSLLALTRAGGISTRNVLAWGRCIVHSQTFGDFHTCRPYLCTEQEAPGTNHPFHSHPCYHPSNARFGVREDATGPLLLYAKRMNKKAALPLPQKNFLLF